MSKWIDVNDRLPKHDTDVLVNITWDDWDDDDPDVIAIMQINSSGRWVSEEWRGFRVTHWRPLPGRPWGRRILAVIQKYINFDMLAIVNADTEE